MATPTAYASCADSIVVFHLLLIEKALSGTPTMPPGRNSALSIPPLNRPPEPPTTEPSARITKADFLFAIWVGPPACFRYHPAFLPGLKVTAVGLYTDPSTMTIFGFLGM